MKGYSEQELFRWCSRCGERYGWIKIPSLNKILFCSCKCDDEFWLEKQREWAKLAYEEIAKAREKDLPLESPF